ncbi:DUF6252 family protein [Flavobacterium psychrotolerans]|uniref:DUF1735 domain-containing protein n=1 Tax=Flavobacterium psychrotolerans TaxID=2169410 RepID=A0A2U1JKY2_9FLAO|nr:DUF6252 family protein [Flavobacterium psychrotolerans]PWA05639.1 hypothetical protein DB895_06570 [Flavobacterium psychrotolerans]
MKKGIYFLLFLIGLTSCSQDVTFNNNAAFQGVKDNVFWKASDAVAKIGTGSSLNIEAVTVNEKLTLTMPLPAKLVSQRDKSTYITYDLGASEAKKAIYVNTLNAVVLTYQTGFGIGDGQIVVTDYDGATISGTFRFNAKNTDATSEEAPILNLQSGVFYKVPIMP